ncbi:MAG: hypothetical protein AAGJ40_18990 [Planctomycetota bacterium]
MNRAASYPSTASIMEATAEQRGVSPQATVRPSIREDQRPFTLDQELKPFCRWVGDTVWVPPKNANRELAQAIRREHHPWSSEAKRWSSVVQQHRDQFTQVREIELEEASIRLPKGRLFVSVTQQKDFDTITDRVPACVQTRLDEFLDRPGRRQDVNVFYLKPLCVEVDDQLLFTSREDLDAAVSQVRQAVMAEHRRQYIQGLPKRCAVGLVHTMFAAPMAMGRRVMRRRRKALEDYRAKLEFQRRKTALRAMRTHQRTRTDGCTYDEMLALTNPLQTEDVVRHYCEQQELSRDRQRQMIQLATGQQHWFLTLTAGLTAMGVATANLLYAAPAVAVCDPAFVAQVPGSNQLLKIGHFDEIAGVTHVEI